MNLRRLRKLRRIWDVLTVEDAGSGRQVQKVMDEAKAHNAKSARMVENMEVLLTRTVPDNGPRVGILRCEKLRDDVFEFKSGPKRGKKLRVLWFYSPEPKTIICTHAFLKDTQATPNPEIEHAVEIKNRYLAARMAGNIRITEDEKDKSNGSNNPSI